jgi:hypothetical protein
VKYREEENTDELTLETRPEFVSVERVYDEGDFSLLDVP